MAAEITTDTGTSPPINGISVLMVLQTSAARTLDLSSILAPSQRACGPKIRLAPLIGFSLPNDGLTALVAR